MDIATREQQGPGEGVAAGIWREPSGRADDPSDPAPPHDDAQPGSRDAQAADVDGAAGDGSFSAADPSMDDAADGSERRCGPGQDKSDEELSQELCVLLFASPEPLSLTRLVELLQRPEPERVRAALARVAERLAGAGLPMVPRELAGGWLLLSDPEYADVLQRLKKEPRPERISSAALETLAIVAYRQPVTKAEVEAIRGVQSGPLLRTLVDRGLVRVSGRADQPGSPLQYATTRTFLDRFGLASLGDLPRDGELTAD